jgi:hypothetical protein
MLFMLLLLSVVEVVAMRGADYDKAGGESGGPGGGGGVLMSGHYLTVTAGENLTISTGSGGAAGHTALYTW